MVDALASIAAVGILAWAIVCAVGDDADEYDVHKWWQDK